MKKVLSLLLAAATTLSMTACASAPAAQTTGGTGSGKVGIAMPTKSLERWNRDGSYLEKQFKDKGYEVELVYSDNDVTQQVNDIENLIADKVNVLVVAAIDGDSLSNVLNTADEANIPVISYDRLIMNTNAVDYYVSFDNYTVGKLQGQYVVDTLGLKTDSDKTYNIEFTAGDPADNNAGFFFNGAYDVLKPFIDAGVLKVVSGQTKFEEVATASWSTDTAMNRMQNILGSYYSDGTQLDIALCSNDSTALGVTNGIIDVDKEIMVAEEYREKLKTKTPSVNQNVGNLSGGNQQKVLLAKWMFADPEVLILDEPSRGIDVGAKYEIYSIMNDLIAQGKSVIMISSELPELLGMCDRIYVMNEGNLVAEMSAAEATQEKGAVLLLAVIFDVLSNHKTGKAG